MSEEGDLNNSAPEVSDNDSQSAPVDEDAPEEDSGVKEVFICGNCPTPDYMYLRLIDLQRHSTQMHKNCTVSYTAAMRNLCALTCSVCGKSANSIRKLSGHAARNHPDVPKTTAAAAAVNASQTNPPTTDTIPPQPTGTPVRKPAPPPAQIPVPNTESLPKRVIKRPFAQESPVAPPLQSAQPVPKRAAKSQTPKTSNGSAATASTTASSAAPRRIDVCERARQFPNSQHVDEALAELTFSPRHEWAFLVASGLTTVGAVRNCPQSELVLIAKPHIGNKRYHLVALCGLANIDPNVFSN